MRDVSTDRAQLSILFVTGTMYPAGSEKQLLNLINAIKNSVDEISVVFFEKGPLYQEYESAGVNLFYIDRGSGLYFSKFHRVWNEYLRIVNYVKPDIVHSQLPQTNMLSCFALWTSDIPLLISERGMGRTRPLWERILRRTAYNRPDCFITNSDAIKLRMIRREKVLPDKIAVIPNSIDLHMPEKDSRPRILDETSIPNESLILTTIGGLRKVKGYDILLHAFASALKLIPSLNLIIVGDGPENKNLEDIVLKLKINNRVSMLGMRHDISDILWASDIYISSSRSEGQSNSILEAMFVGLPVIATSVGGTIEIITNNENGVLIEPENPNILAQAIVDLSSNPEKRKKLGQQAERAVREKYTSSNVAKLYLQFLSDILGNR